MMLFLNLCRGSYIRNVFTAYRLFPIFIDSFQEALLPISIRTKHA